MVALPGVGEGHTAASLPMVTAPRSCDTRYPPLAPVSATLLRPCYTDLGVRADVATTEANLIFEHIAGTALT